MDEVNCLAARHMGKYGSHGQYVDRTRWLGRS
ncbi:hypothetical protein B0G81_7753 [Paraburkholderia sp. BL6665CI2N2]|nr:hypothetical protein B0G81_7753 [Paraburkholderia sp. BL6665CI2N2]